MKIKKIACLLMALAMIWMTASCRINDGSVTELTDPPGIQHPSPTDPTDGVTEPSEEVTEPDAAEPTGSEDVTVPSEGTEAPSEPMATGPADSEPTEPGATDGTEAAPSEPGVTDPEDVEPPTVPVVTEPPATEPVSSEPAVTVPDPADPPVTEPVVTDPPATEVDPTDSSETEPALTEPPATEHVHDYSTKVVKPTCTKKGYTKYTCECGDSYKGDYVDKLEHSYTTEKVTPACGERGYTLYTCACGDSFKDDFTAPLDHDYQAGEIVEATAWKEGYTLYTCSHCGDSYEGDKTDKIPQKEFERQVAEAVVKYINQYRVAQGDTEAQILPGPTLVAEYRAVQLTDNFEHSLTDLREAYAYYSYGEWVDATEYGLDESRSYYTADAKEAIARGGSGSTPDEIGHTIANVFHNSKNHWAYLGSSDFPYIGIGVAFDPAGSDFYTCTLQTRENYG